MAKAKEDREHIAPETQQDSTKTKRQEWARLETLAIKARAELADLEDRTAKAASEAAEEAKASGVNGVRGPGEHVYLVQANRKPKGSEEPPKYPYTLRRAPEIRT